MLLSFSSIVLNGVPVNIFLSIRDWSTAKRIDVILRASFPIKSVVICVFNVLAVLIISESTDEGEMQDVT